MKRVLLIDDDELFAAATAALLKSEGYEVATAANGLDGVKAATAEQPDVVLCDLVMQPVDGLMTLSILRHNTNTAQIPFVIVSGQREIDAVRKSMVLGADEYLPKPFTPDELLEVTARMLKVRHAAKAASRIIVHELQTLLGSPLETHLSESMDQLRFTVGELHSLVPATAAVNATKHRLQAEREIEGLSRAISNARLLSHLEVVAGNADAVRMLRDSRPVRLRPLLEAEIGRYGRSDGRTEDCEYEMEDVAIRMDQACLLRVLDELARNALAYSPHGSKIRVMARNIGQAAHVDIANDCVGDLTGNTTIQVKKMDFESILPKEFNQGFGLKIAYSLIAMHGGTLSIRRPAVRQVCLHLHLPL
ncbi:MAG: response regulator [Limisphaerales bacterium]